jgi:hypothetical protein
MTPPASPTSGLSLTKSNEGLPALRSSGGVRALGSISFRILPSCAWIGLVESKLGLRASQSYALRQPANSPSSSTCRRGRSRQLIKKNRSDRTKRSNRDIEPHYTPACLTKNLPRDSFIRYSMAVYPGAIQSCALPQPVSQAPEPQHHTLSC